MKITSIAIALIIALTSCSKDDNNTTNDDSTTNNDNNETSHSIVFKAVPTDGVTPEFEMAETEVSYQQYVDFLNSAYADGFITYNSNDKTVRDGEGSIMTNLDGVRVTKDHNQNGIYELEDMENPLNINFIEFDETNNTFYIQNPLDIDWSVYFDDTIYPNVVDSSNDWFELSGNQNGFYDAKWDADGAMPTIEEIKTWPANHIRYFGAHAFAEYYSLDLPTKAQWNLAAKGGNNNQYATHNGNGTTDDAIIGSVLPGWPPHKGHVQPVKSIGANSLGLYNLGGNAWEWCKDWYDGPNPLGNMTRPLDSDYFIDDELSPATGYGQGYYKTLLGGSFNYFVATMEVPWNHAAMMHAGNDHFGFRVVKNN